MFENGHLVKAYTLHPKLHELGLARRLRCLSGRSFVTVDFLGRFSTVREFCDFTCVAGKGLSQKGLRVWGLFAVKVLGHGGSR